MQKRIIKITSIFATIMALLVPGALAIRTGFDPMDDLVKVIANFFHIPALKGNTLVQVGFLKFMFWIVIFTFVHYTLKKVFNKLQYDNPNRIGGIIAFAFTTISIVFMPDKWLLAQGGVVVVLLSSLIFLGIVLGISYLVFFQLPNKDAKENRWLLHIFGLLLLFFLYYIVGFWGESTGTLGDVLQGGFFLPFFWRRK